MYSWCLIYCCLGCWLLKFGTWIQQKRVILWSITDWNSRYFDLYKSRRKINLWKRLESFISFWCRGEIQRVHFFNVTSIPCSNTKSLKFHRFWIFKLSKLSKASVLSKKFFIRKLHCFKFQYRSNVLALSKSNSPSRMPISYNSKFHIPVRRNGYICWRSIWLQLL